MRDFDFDSYRELDASNARSARMNPKIKQLQDNVGATGHKVPTQKLLNAIKEVECGDLVSYSSLDDFVKAFA